MSSKGNQPTVRDYPTIFVYARVRKMYFPNAPRSRLTLFESVRPDGSGVFTTLFPLKEREMFGCSAVLALRTVPTRDHQLLYIVNEFRPNSGDVEVARLVLPLVWFPPGRLVSFVYPLITRRPEEGGPMLAVDVHLSTGQSPPFGVPPGQLRVLPTWEIPEFMKSDGIEEIQRPPDGALRIPISSLLPEELLVPARLGGGQ
jgi:hypothetical protein